MCLVVQQSLHFLPLSPWLINHISALPISKSSPDLIVCNLSLGKFFNSHDLYSFLHQSKTPLPTTFSWNLIWKIQCPPKISIFLWQIAWDALPTRCTLYHRSILHTSDLPSCPSPVETSIHCLRYCLVAKEFWIL